jgi:glycosyltransferase involved in cell wall biosynthesis
MKISVIIPCYNEIATIAELIHAVRSAPYDDREIIVVDDCSKDGTRELLMAELSPLVTHVILHERIPARVQRCVAAQIRQDCWVTYLTCSRSRTRRGSGNASTLLSTTVDRRRFLL